MMYVDNKGLVHHAAVTTTNMPGTGVIVVMRCRKTFVHDDTFPDGPPAVMVHPIGAKFPTCASCAAGPP